MSNANNLNFTFFFFFHGRSFADFLRIALIGRKVRRVENIADFGSLSRIDFEDAVDELDFFLLELVGEVQRHFHFFEDFLLSHALKWCVALDEFKEEDS